MKKWSLSFCLLYPSILLLSQAKPTSDPSKATAKDNFVFGAWRLAQQEYLALLKTDSTNAQYNYRTGICYLQLFEDRKKAVFYLEKAIKYKTGEKDAPFMLAKAYHLDYQFDHAIQKYNEAIASSTDQGLIERAKLYIEMCHTAKKMLENPRKNIEIKNAGPSINSVDPDYLPYIQEDHAVIYFTTRRSKGNPGYLSWDGLYTSDIFLATDKDGEWTKSRAIGGSVGTSNDEEIVGLSPDGEVMFINFFDFKTKEDVQITEKINKQFKKPESIADPVSLSNSVEISGCLTPDKQGLYFSSNRAGGKGGLDIYYSKKLPTGQWSAPVNVEELNSPYDDSYPHMVSSGQTMYFSSEGHGSMGGYDIFYCQWDTSEKKWTDIKNIGFPINTPENDYNISIDNTGRSGYISTFRKEDSMGDLDIYEVTFLDVDPRVSTVVAKLFYQAPIDYQNYQTFITCEKEGIKKKFIPEYMPDTSVWKVIERKTETVKPGSEYKTFITLEKSGVSKVYPLEKLPTDHKTYKFINIESKTVPIKDFKLALLPTQTKVYLDQGSIDLLDLKSNQKIAEFVVSSKNQRIIMALSEGKNKITIKAEGFKPLATEMSVPGKSSYEFKVDREFELIPEKKIPAVHYTKIPK